jgi:pseudaminic acid synthase
LILSVKLVHVVICILLSSLSTKGDKLKINGKELDNPISPYIIAEMSGNHGNNFETAKNLLLQSAEAGADAFKLQTYTPDSLTLKCDRSEYIVDQGPWKNRTLYDLYSQGQTPNEWIPDLIQIANSNNISLFSTPFSLKDVDVLESYNVPAYKIASFEITFTQLLKYIAQTGKPIIFSTGLATISEIDQALDVLHSSGAHDIAILKCTTSYPADYFSLNLKTIGFLKEKYEIPIGFSDHTEGNVAAIAAVSHGATILEKHVKLDNDNSSVDSTFSLPVSKLQEYIEAARDSALSIGGIQDGPTEKENGYMKYRRSIVASRNIKKNEEITLDNVVIVRPAIGLKPNELNKILGKKATRIIKFGEGIRMDSLT